MGLLGLEVLLEEVELLEVLLLLVFSTKELKLQLVLLVVSKMELQQLLEVEHQPVLE